MRRSISSKGMPVERERRELPGEDPGELLVREAAELAALGSGPIEHACLDLVVGDLTLLRHGAQRLHGSADRRREIPAFMEPIAERVGQLLGVATDRDEPLFVRDGSVEQDVVDARCPRSPINLADHDLDLVGLHLLGEDGGERLRVRVGEIASFDVLAPVLIAPEIRESDARDTELLELGVLADSGECDPVVDLTDLVQGCAGVLGDEQQPICELEPDHRAAAGDALVGVVRPVLHELLGSHVRHEAHDALRSRKTASTAATTWSSGTSCDPSTVTVIAFGQIRRMESGPPVAASSSAASISASTAT